jgi:hypothetical protein
MLTVVSFSAADEVAASAQQYAMMTAMVDGHGGAARFSCYFAHRDERCRSRSQIDNKEAWRAVLVTARLFS